MVTTYRVNETLSPLHFSITPITSVDALDHPISTLTNVIVESLNEDLCTVTFDDATMTGTAALLNAGSVVIQSRITGELGETIVLDEIGFVIEHGPVVGYQGGSFIFVEDLGDPIPAHTLRK